MKVDILIKSYFADFKLLRYALLSITKNVTGYNNIILLIPEKEKQFFDTRELPPRTLIHYVNEYGKGWLYQQWCKVSAHKYSDADYILFSDSDCIFTKPIDVQDYIGKPEILYTSWDKVGDAKVWKAPTEKIMGEPVEWEFMRRNCLIYHRSTLEKLNEWRPELESEIMSRDSFSEFNLIGAYAFKFERDKYNFINTDSWTYTEPKAVQLWSHGRRDTGDVLHMKEYVRALETIVRLFDPKFEL